ncbi:MAG: valine--tRNA ligase, partial [bacterium]
EKELAKEGITRHDLGREKFLDRVWEWKERYGRRILEQKYLLGDSADWHRERFTLDPGLSRAVTKVFVHLYRKGLIYRGNYIVNWCPRCHTAISDEEVDHKDTTGYLWYIRYPLVSSHKVPIPGSYIVVATTRPETMLGDTAVAVNPSDPLRNDMIGETVQLPLTNRNIPIIGDDWVDPNFGTGFVKVTPAHDPNDFQIAQRHQLPFLVIMDTYGKLNENAPEEFRGLERFEARKKVVEALEKKGLLEKIEPYQTSIGHCSRCDTIIEPYLSLQWFVKMKPLAQPAIQAVKEGKIRFYPSRWEKVYYNWLENIQDWCISRQLWWGHRIPVWYCQQCGQTVVEEDVPSQCPSCGSIELYQDEDVLDTWFSSWLWPFSTLGWPEETPEMKFWYPTDVLVSGYDIIFFWIARMIMAGLEFTGEIPFRDVFLTGMIKDELGRWMSKSLGNGIDPQEMVEVYGSDAVRFTLITLATEGQDIKLAPSRFEGGRNFANKIWNAYRFLATHAQRLKPFTLDDKELLDGSWGLQDRWISSRLSYTIDKVLEATEKYRLFESITVVYDFIWKEFCDWYLEMIKGRFNSQIPIQIQKKTIVHALSIFEVAMRLIHPAMPFITEEIWQSLLKFQVPFKFLIPKPHLSPSGKDVWSIMVQPYPTREEFPRYEEAESKLGLIQKVVSEIREIRSLMKVSPEKKVKVIVNSATPEQKETILTMANLINLLAGVDDLIWEAQRPRHSALVTVDGIELFIPLEGILDIDSEKHRIDREIERLEGILRGIESKLNHPEFLKKAPNEVVEGERKKAEDIARQLEVLRRNRSFLE